MPLDLNQFRIPDDPGCYLYKNAAGIVIYVGKAKNLKKRVLSYFSKEHEDLKTRLLVPEIADIEFFVTKTEVEALLLESRLIKKHLPKYNVLLKDSKGYAYLLMTEEKFPRLIVARHKQSKGEYFGPFVSGQLRSAVLRVVRDTFQLRTCQLGQKKPCLRYHMGLCRGVCAGLETEEQYNLRVQSAIRFLRGHREEFIEELRAMLARQVRDQQYELAQMTKAHIDALSSLSEKQRIESSDPMQEDVINIVDFQLKSYIAVMTVRSGVVQGKEHFTLDASADVLEEFLKRYYEDHGEQIPRTLVVPRALQDDSIASYLSERAGHRVDIVVPVRGSKKDLLDLVRKNIEVLHAEKDLLADQFRQWLGIKTPVHRIECFDISHFQGSYMVGSMVRFVDGKPNKANYRRFKIKTVTGIDDFRSIAEIVKRRYTRLVEEQHTKNFVGFPDCIVIDGGSEQLAFAKEQLDALGLSIPVVGLAKQFEEIYFPGRKYPARFDKKSPVMRVLIAARDEAHRFGVSYHRLLRSRSLQS